MDITSALTAKAVAEMVASRITISHGFMGNIMNQVVFFEHLMAGEAEGEQREWSRSGASPPLPRPSSFMPPTTVTRMMGRATLLPDFDGSDIFQATAPRSATAVTAAATKHGDHTRHANVSRVLFTAFAT